VSLSIEFTCIVIVSRLHLSGELVPTGLYIHLGAFSSKDDGMPAAFQHSGRKGFLACEDLPYERGIQEPASNANRAYRIW